MSAPMPVESAYWKKFRELYGDPGEHIAADPEVSRLPAMSRKQFLATLAASASRCSCSMVRRRAPANSWLETRLVPVLGIGAIG